MKLFLICLVIALVILVQTIPTDSHSGNSGQALAGSLGGGNPSLRGGASGETGHGLPGKSAEKNSQLKGQWESKPQTGK